MGVAAMAQVGYAVHTYGMCDVLTPFASSRWAGGVATCTCCPHDKRAPQAQELLFSG